jgi:hypothetical protein
MRRLLPIVATIACALAMLPAGLGAADDEVKDRVFLKEGRTIEGTVESEGAEEVTYRTAGNAQPGKKRGREVLRVEYGGMTGEGDWTAGVIARDQGRYDEAADRFSVVAQGEREWQKVYGGLAEGEALELARKYADAAARFAAVATDFPKHRLALDAQYRAGMALALAGKADDAQKVADTLAEIGKKNPAGESRANAVRSAAFAAAKNKGKFDEFTRKTIFRPGDEPEVWFHFNLWLADALRLDGRGKEAARIADGMIGQLDANPARKMQAVAIKGQCLVDSDPQGALTELLKLDVLPFGSEDQKCEARFQAGRLLLAEVKALRLDPKDERKMATAVELERTARLVLQAAADSTSASPAKIQAKDLLATLPAEAGPAAPAEPAAAAPAAPAK